MQVTWDPRNGDPLQEWQFDPDEVEADRAKAIEKNYGGAYDSWVAALHGGEVAARQVLLWYMLSELHPTLKFESLPKFRVKQLQVQMGSAELKKLWDRVTRMNLPRDKRDAFEMAFETDMRDALDREGRPDDRIVIGGGRFQIEGAEELPKPA